MPIHNLARVEPKAVDWLLPGFIPLGKFTDLAGDMDQGKSLFTLWLAAQVTTGNDPGSVLIYALEDDEEDTLVPRIMAAGGDVARIHVVDDDYLTAEALDSYCEELGDVRLVIADPINAFLKCDPWKTPAVRKALAPILKVAAGHRFALVGVQHFNRADTDQVLARIGDAQGFPQVARSVIAWGHDPHDPEGDDGSLRVAVTGKHNLTRKSTAASFRVEEAPVVIDGTSRGIPRIVHAGRSEVRARDLLNPRTVAEKFLADKLADGPRAAGDVIGEGERLGITEKRLRTALKRLGGESRKTNFEGAWDWSIPVEMPVPF